MRLLVLVAVAACSLPAAAQDQACACDAPEKRWWPSGGAALASSAGATALGLGLVGGVYFLDSESGGPADPAIIALGIALVTTPSAGNVLLGEGDDALVGLALRAVGAGAVAYGASQLDFADGSAPGVVFLVVGGAAAFLTGVGYDVVTQVRNGSRAGQTVRVEPGGAGLALRVGL